MLSLLANISLLAFLQALIPNHWVPVVALSESENWGKPRQDMMASISASAHVLGTLLLGLLFDISGTSLAHTFEQYVHLSAPIVMVVFGLLYWVLTQSKYEAQRSYPDQRKVAAAWKTGIVLMMLVSPCLEVHALFIAAGDYGINLILLLALVYAAINILSVLTLTILAGKFSGKLFGRFDENGRKKFTALLIILVGVASFFIH